MSQQLFSLHSWPRAIAHIDGDAFFTSCEEAIHPERRGKALITGGERGIVACASYPAKKLGIKRGVPLHEARKICPGLIDLEPDASIQYSLFDNPLQAEKIFIMPQMNWDGNSASTLCIWAVLIL